MPDLSRFAAFARKERSVPHVPHATTVRGTEEGTGKSNYSQCLIYSVPRVPHVPRRNDNGWDENDWRMAFEERAAILEYDGGHSRQEAERLAREEIDRMRANS